MAAQQIQLGFSLRTSSNCKTVHLVGSWDNYSGQLPLGKDPNKSGGWKGQFRFPGSTLKQGTRYWYYYIIDGYHVSHDPARESVTEPTTGRKLNTLDIPTAKGAVDTSHRSSDRNSSNRHSRRISTQTVAKGRSISPSKIQSPKPTKPHETRQITQENFKNPTVEELSRKFSSHQISDSESDSDESSEEETDSDSDVPSLTSRSSNNSSPSSMSSASSCCTCERYGITRNGNRVKLDCKGSRCGYSDGSECSSESEDDHRNGTTRRQGIVVRK